MSNDPNARPPVKGNVPETEPGEWLIIRIRPPESSPMLRELFVLEVVVRRDCFTAWPEKSRNAKPGESPHVKFDGGDLRMVHVPCRLSSYTVLGERLPVDHYALPLDLKVNCSLKLDSKSDCLISGSIISGSIRVLNPEVALKWSEPFFHALWPTETAYVCGIYLSRSQFHMEVIQDAMDVTPKGAEEGASESAVQRNATAPKEALRLSYVGDVPKSDGTSQGRLWKLVYCPQDTCADATPVDPAERVGYYRNQIDAIAKKLKSFEVLESLESAAIYYFVDVQNHQIREILKPGMTIRFVNTDSSVTRWKPGTLLINRSLSVSSTAATSESYELVDYDEVNLILTTGRPADSKTVADVSLEMEARINNAAAWQVTKIPYLYLAGTQNQRKAEQDYMWCVANLTPKDSGEPSYQGRPASWVRIRIGKPKLSPSTVENGDLRRLHDLSGPLILHHEDQYEGSATPVVKPENWTLTVDMPQKTAQHLQETGSPRFSLTLRKEASGGVKKYSAVIKLANPEIKATSGPMALYDQPLTDPQSAPNEKQFETKLTLHNLIFRNASGYSKEKPDEGLLTARLRSNSVEFECGQDVVVGYLPASRALIDPVSATAGNLTTHQIIDLPVASGELEKLKEPSASNTIKLKSELSFDPKGLWIELSNGTETEILQIKERDPANTKSLTLDREWKPVANKTYTFVVGPTRLALPRDPNHGLIPLHFKKFQLWIPSWLVEGRQLPELRFDINMMRGTEVSSVMALLPWAEWGPTPNAWLKSGRVRVHHRNLVMEHAEFESSFEDRFPASGPSAATLEETQSEETQGGKDKPVSPLLPFEDFVNAVRDRYTEASGNLLPDRKDKDPNETRLELRNWFPGTKMLNASGTEATSQLRYAEDSANPLPAVKLSWHDTTGASVSEPAREQVLQVRQPGPTDTNWLEFDFETKVLKTDQAPEVVIKDADPHADPKTVIPHGDFRVVNSSGPLIFNAAAVTAVAYCELPKKAGATEERYAVLLATHDGKARLWASSSPANLVSFGDGNSNRINSADLYYLNGRVFALIGHTDGTTAIWSAGLGDTDDTPHDPEKRWDAAIPATEQITTARFARYPDQMGVIVGVRTRAGGKPGKAYLWKKWDWDTGQPSGGPTEIVWQTPGVSDAVSDVAVSVAADNEYVLLGGAEGHAEVQDMTPATPTHWELKKLKEAPPVRAADLACDTEGKFVAVTVRTDGTAETWKEESEKPEPLDHPAAVSSVRFVAIENLDDVSPKPTKSGPYFITGCRDGMVRLWDLSAVKPRESRHFRVPSGVVSCFSASSSLDKSQPPRIVAGTQLGRSGVWLAKSAEETTAPPPLRPDHMLDNLGVVRELPFSGGKEAEEDWIVEKVRDPNAEALWDAADVGHQLLSVTTPGFFLAFSDGTDNRTEIRFVCEGLKVRRNGDVYEDLDELPFHTAPYYMGTYGFSSSISANTGHDELAVVDNWPRLAGVPIFVTRLRKLTFEEDTVTGKFTANRVQFEAVIANPDAVRAVEKPREDVPDVPGFVWESLARKAVILVDIDLTKSSVIESVTVSAAGSSFDWTFAINRQTQAEFPERGFDGRLVRISGTVEFPSKGSGAVKNAIELTLEHTKCEASALERNWPLLEETVQVGKEISPVKLKLLGEGKTVEVDDDLSPGKASKQDGFSFRNPLRNDGFTDQTTTQSSLFLLNAPQAIVPGSLKWSTVYPPEAPIAPAAAAEAAEEKPSTLAAAPVVCVANGKAHVLDPWTGGNLGSFGGDNSDVTCADLLTTTVKYPKGTAPPPYIYLLIGCKGGKAHLWDLASGAGLMTWPIPQAFTSVCFSASGTIETPQILIVTAATDRKIRVFAWDSDAEVTESEDMGQAITVLATTSKGPDEEPLLLSAVGNKVFVWAVSPPPNALKKVSTLIHAEPVDSVTAEVVGKDIYVATVAGGKGFLWKTIDGDQNTPSETFTHPEAGTQFQCAALLNDGREASIVFAPKSAGGSSLLWRVQSNKSVPEWEFKIGVPVSGLAARHTPNGPRVLQCSAGPPTKVSAWTTDKVLRISTEPGKAPDFHLPISLLTNIADRYPLKAHITPTKQLLLVVEDLPSGKGFLSPTSAWPVLVQGMYYCFLLNLTSADRNRGGSALILWNEGDIAVSGGPAGIGGIFLSETIRKFEQIKLSLEDGETEITMSGVGLEVEIIGSSLMDSKLSWKTGKIVTCHLSSEDADTPFSIQLGEQSITQNGSAAVITGLLTMTLKDKDNKDVMVQCPVRMKYELADDLSRTSLTLEKDVYLARHVVPVGKTSTGEAHIVIPDPNPDPAKRARFFRLSEVRPAPLPPTETKVKPDAQPQENKASQFFVIITLDADTSSAAAVPGAAPQPKLRFRKVSELPLDLCLEQEVSTDMPRAPAKIMQVVHRRLYGSRVRYSVSTEKYKSFLAFEEETAAPSKDNRPFTTGKWLLSPLVSVEDGVRVLEDSFLLRDVTDTPNVSAGKLVTQNLLVANRPTGIQEKPGGETDSAAPACMRAPARDAPVLPVTAVLNATTNGQAPTPQSGTTEGRANGDARFQDELKKAGAAGAAMVRTLSEFRAGEYRFVNSPFYSEVPLETGRPVEGLVPLRREAMLAAADLLPAEAVEAGIVVRPSLDFRLVLPADLMRWAGTLGLMRYVPDLPPEDPLAMDDCQPLRAVRLRRRNMHGDNGPEAFSGDVVPHVHLLEAVAFRKMAPLFHLPRLGRRSEADHLFLPRSLDLTYAADKPGAVFHHLFQTRTGRRLPERVTWHWTMEPSIDFALREPQQIKVTRCVTAEVKIKEAALNDSPVKTNNVQRLSMKWDEVLGKVSLTNSDSNSDKEPFSIALEGTELKTKGQPFQMIVQFNQDLLEVKPKDYVIPGYRIDPPALDDTPAPPIFRPASVYIVGQNDKLPDPVSVGTKGTVEPFVQLFREEEHKLEAVDPTGANGWRIVVSQASKADPIGWLMICGAPEETNANGFWRILPSPLAGWSLHGPTVGTTPSTGEGSWETGNKTGVVKQAGVGSPIVITTDKEHTLGFGDGVTIKNVQGNANANGTFRVVPTGPTTFEIWAEATFSSSNVLQNARYAFGFPFRDLLIPGDPATMSGYFVWKLDEQAVHKWQEQGMIFQVMWAGEITTSKGKEWKQVALYEVPKLFKFILPCMLSPKLAAVLLAKPAVAADHDLFLMQRTILFGDSAPARNGGFEIRPGQASGTFDFVFLAKDNTEDVTVPLAEGAAVQHGIDLYLLKYLPTGQTVFDLHELPKTPPKE